MLPQFADVCLACIPASELPVLADVRVVPGLTVFQQADSTWVRWENQDEDVLRRLLPVRGVVFYSWSEGRWCRMGSCLPAFEVPVDVAFQPLFQLLFPAPVQPLPAPTERNRQAMRLGLLPDYHTRPASALLAAAEAILSWAENVPSFRLAELRAARNRKEILVLGNRLPAVASGQRFWGKSVLVPLGFRLDPDLPETLVRIAFALKPGDLLLASERTQVIPRDVFEPLCRASLRRLVMEVKA